MMTGDLNEDKKPISYEGLRRRGGKRRESPGCFYPIFISMSDGMLHSVGEPIAKGVDRHSVVPPVGTWAAWPINEDGTESRWQIRRERFISQLVDSTLVLSSYDRDRESATILYLKNADLQKIENGVVKIIGKSPNGQLIAKLIESDVADNTPKSIWVMNSHDASVYGTTLHKKFVPNSDFAFPKSLYAVEDGLRFFVEGKPNALVVDFFAGSGTTAHAVMRLNHQDGGQRRCICITNNEVNAKDVESYVGASLREGDSEWEKHGIFHSITMPRIKAAIYGRTEDGKPIAGNYGLKRDSYSVDEDAQALSKSSGKPIRKTVYVRQKIQDPAVPDPFLIAEGFEENAIFYELEYLEPSIIQADMAFNEIAPLLWLKAGSKGRVIRHGGKYDITDNYAVLFDYRYIGSFTREVQKKPDVKTIFIVTDHDARYRDMCAAFPDRHITQLYESYLRSFEISSEV
jgi:adenine-specific DNA-methyltransferase